MALSSVLLLLAACTDATFPDDGGRFVDVYVGGLGACALDDEGAATCWGEVGVMPDVRWRMLDLGFPYACGIDLDRKMWCWEYESYSQDYKDEGLDFGQWVAREGEWAAVETGIFYTCGLSESGRLECWGVGEGGPGTNEHDRGQVRDAPTGTFTEVSLNSRGGCVIKATDGQVNCWGGGHGIAFDDPRFVYVDIDVDYRVGCGVRDDGLLHCWDEEFSTERSSLLWNELGPFTQVAVGAYPCGLRAGGQADCMHDDDPEGGWRCAAPPAARFSTLQASGTEQVCGVTLSGGVLCFGVPRRGDGECEVGGPEAFFRGDSR